MRPLPARPIAVFVIVGIASAMLAITVAQPAHAADAQTYMTGTQFLAAAPDRQAAYVAGLADSLVGLYRAQMVDGFRWFENCIAHKSPADLTGDLAKFLNENPARREEPTANNIIWAMGAACKYP